MDATDVIYGLWQIFDIFLSEDLSSLLKIIVFVVVFAILSSKDDKKIFTRLRGKRQTPTVAATGQPATAQVGTQQFAAQTADDNLPTQCVKTQSAADSPRLTPETLISAVVWSEILAKPRSVRRIR